jgi:uncharacterized membrane protein YkvA (DUF1232 family)
VGDQLEFHPTNLSRSLFDHLCKSAHDAESIPPAELLAAAHEHLERTRAAHAQNRMVNLRFASAIVAALDVLIKDWGSIQPNQAWWLRGAMQYFASSDDDEPDFLSPLGFEDDAEILNACLKFIGRSDLCLNAEDFDNA